MAGNNWQVGGVTKLAVSVVGCLVATAATSGAARAGFELAPTRYLGSFDAEILWELLIGGFVAVSFLASVAIWAMSSLRRISRAHHRRGLFVSSALNSLNQGVVMVDALGKVMFCNDRYLEIYGLRRSDIVPNMTGLELLELRRSRGMLDVATEEFYRTASGPNGHIADLPNGRSVLVKFSNLANGGSIATHDDCTPQRELSRQLATAKQFLESVIDNIPVCVAAKAIEDGRYILANRAFERFCGLPRDRILGRRTAELLGIL